MLQKESLLSAIDGLVLITEDHRIRLKELVKRLDSQKDLSLIEELILQEPEIIKNTVHRIIEIEVEVGETKILEVIDTALKKLTREERKGARIMEHEERKTEEKEAEQLLNDMEA